MLDAHSLEDVQQDVDKVLGHSVINDIWHYSIKLCVNIDLKAAQSTSLPASIKPLRSAHSTICKISGFMMTLRC